MRHLLTFISVLLVNLSISQTNITSFYVSGSWTLSSSPYLIQNDITILPSQSLTIEPGVVVKFISESSLMINGQLIADGVTFCAIDTAGWSNQSITDGGWNGIHFMPFSGIDLSVFKNCTIRDCKYGYSSVVMYSNAFTCNRTLDIDNCLFEHNHSGIGMYVAGANIELSTQSDSNVITFNNCTVKDNYSVFAIIRSWNYYGGSTNITNSQIHDNYLGSAIWGLHNNLLIEGNEIFNNISEGDNCPVKLSIGEAVVRGNSIHHNECEELAAVGCRSGNITIENNLICNNFQSSGDCGELGGGGGLHLAHNEGGALFSDTYYLVRNNIIANNYSAYAGGGVYVHNSRATISNNNIVNNSTAGDGNSILISSPLSEVYMKNNLFLGKSVLGAFDSLDIIHVVSAMNIEFDYNYTPSGFDGAFFSESSFNIIGDTTHNIIGVSPGMVSPTANNDVYTDATISDFNLLLTSDCIDNGDTAYAQVSNVDYLGNVRIVDTIDIGAFEQARTSSLPTYESAGNLYVYPNPVMVNGFVFVATPSSEGKITVTDISGKILFEDFVTQSQTTISLLGLSSGVYVVIFDDAKIIKTSKLIIQN